jgi:hypothetical protein
MRIRIQDSEFFFTLDTGWKNLDPRSGINIPDPQHALLRIRMHRNRSILGSRIRVRIKVEIHSYEGSKEIHGRSV